LEVTVRIAEPSGPMLEGLTDAVNPFVADAVRVTVPLNPFRLWE